VAAFVISDEPVDVAWARAWFEEQGVARFKTPERMIRVDELPLLGIGKPDRAALRAQAARDEAGSWTSH
jgi:non-ribosomal peptide synthetase component E (peptide arylation enzyme)